MNMIFLLFSIIISLFILFIIYQIAENGFKSLFSFIVFCNLIVALLKNGLDTILKNIVMVVLVIFISGIIESLILLFLHKHSRTFILYILNFICLIGGCFWNYNVNLENSRLIFE